MRHSPDSHLPAQAVPIPPRRRQQPAGNLQPIVNVRQALLNATIGTADTNRSTAPCSALAVRRQLVLEPDRWRDRQLPANSRQTNTRRDGP